jgi:hypothetical protein
VSVESQNEKLVIWHYFGTTVTSVSARIFYNIYSSIFHSVFRVEIFLQNMDFDVRKQNLLRLPARHRSRGGRWAIRSGTREYARAFESPAQSPQGLCFAPFSFKCSSRPTRNRQIVAG